MLRTFTKVVTILTLFALLSAMTPVQAADHVVTESDLNQALLDSSKTRAQNAAKVEQFLTSPQAFQALQSAGLDARKVEQAIPQLTDEELNRLAAQTEQIQNDFAAGALSNRELTWLVIGIGIVVLIILIAD